MAGSSPAIGTTKGTSMKTKATRNPVMPMGSLEHIPEFISNKPDPATGIPKEDHDRDIHDTIYQTENMISDRHVGGATHEGDMGRLSKL